MDDQFPSEEDLIADLRATQRQSGMTLEECDAVAARAAQAARDRYHGAPTTTNGFAGSLGRLRPVLTPVPDGEVPF